MWLAVQIPKRTLLLLLLLLNARDAKVLASYLQRFFCTFSRKMLDPSSRAFGLVAGGTRNHDAPDKPCIRFELSKSLECCVPHNSLQPHVAYGSSSVLWSQSFWHVSDSAARHLSIPSALSTYIGRILWGPKYRNRT